MNNRTRLSSLALCFATCLSLNASAESYGQVMPAHMSEWFAKSPPKVVRTGYVLFCIDAASIEEVRDRFMEDGDTRGWMLAAILSRKMDVPMWSLLYDPKTQVKACEVSDPVQLPNDEVLEVKPMKSVFSSRLLGRGYFMNLPPIPDSFQSGPKQEIISGPSRRAA